MRKLWVRLLLGYFLIVGLATWLVLNVFSQEVKPGVRLAVEDTLIDTANLLAELAVPAMEHERDFESSQFVEQVEAYIQRKVNAPIYGFIKQNLELRVLVTNQFGIVLYDSQHLVIGQDYSKWRDIYLTLRGKYGARSTAEDKQDPNTTVMHVAAPILLNGKIIGVLSVSKANSSVAPFIERSEQKIWRAGIFLIVASVCVGLFFAAWLTWSLYRLQRYAKAVARGESAKPPFVLNVLPNRLLRRKISRFLGGSEIVELAQAIESMRTQLEGKQYVEQYIHTLTHEMKSPLTAISGAAELLEENLPIAQRDIFVKNIQEQTERLKVFINKMLELASVESKTQLVNTQLLNVVDLLNVMIEHSHATLVQKKIQCVLSINDHEASTSMVSGDKFLLSQALQNLFDNAIDFSPIGGKITIGFVIESGLLGAKNCIITIQDQGSGIPDYALSQIFERFFSLPRPISGKKSTGLGLSFVRQVVQLHGGDVSLSNCEPSGVIARVVLPMI